MPVNLENSAVAMGLEKPVFIPIPKNVQITTQLHAFHKLEVMITFLQASLQQDVNQELADVQAGFRGTRDQIANIH